MGSKKAAGDNAKKVAGNSKKAEAAAAKQAAADAKKAAEEEKEWAKGAAKGNAKKEQADAKKADAARKKADRDALLAAEEETQKSKPKSSSKAVPKKSKGTLDLAELDSGPSDRKGAAIHASGIDNALDALSLSNNPSAQKVERHPERRYKAAYAAYEERRLPEVEKEQPGLRRQQRIKVIQKEFEKHEDNPFNQASVAYDATRDEVAEVKEAERAKIESRLTR